MTQSIADMSALKLAYAAQQLEPSQRVLAAEPIAVIGMSCRFPGGADSIDGYWRLLAAGGDAIVEIPAPRWDLQQLFDANPKAPGKHYCRHGGYLADVHGFDPEFFAITPREARAMDPQQRLILEVAWEALVSAGIDPPTVYGSNTAVTIGAGTADFGALRLASGQRAAIDPYYVSGSTLSVIAGRLSYTLGFNGPSFVVDTACSSSLVAVHQACEALRRRECDMALSGGVGLVLAPEPHIAFCKAGMLAPDGRCKTFDAAANGYGRGEGCGVIVLKRLSAAMADGNRVLAVIRGSAVNQDGASGGLTVPSGPSQQAVIRAALGRAGLRPDSIDAIEAHGTGTSLGDPIEMGALGEVFCGAPRPRSLYVGSAKTNLGHLESAAGIAGLIKIVLAMNHGQIPPHLHFKTPNPKINWQALDVTIPTALLPWTPGSDGKRRAGVSAFGFAGTNAFVVLESASTENRLPVHQVVPFQRRPLWIDDHRPVAPIVESAVTVLPGKRLHLPFSPELRFEAHFAAGSPRFVDDHRIYGDLIVAGAAHLAYAIECYKTAFGTLPGALQRLTFMQTLTLPPDSGRTVQAICKPSANDTFSWELVSAAATAPTAEPWVRHVTGELHRTRPASPPPRVDVERLRRSWSPLAGAALYDEIAAMGHHLGPSFRRIETVWSHEREALCRLTAPSHIEDSYSFHPGLLDSCLHWLCVKGPAVLFGDGAKRRQEEEVYIPFYIESVRFWHAAAPSAALYCHTRIRPDNQREDGISGDLHLFDEQGQSLLFVEGLTVRRLRKEATPHRDSGAAAELYRVDWELRPTAQKTPAAAPARRFLIFSDGTGVAAALARALDTAGHRVTLLGEPASGEANPVHIADPAMLGRLLDQHGPFDEIVDLTSLALRVRPDDPLLGCELVLHLVQALQKRQWLPRLRLVVPVGWLATDADTIHPTAAPLWGLGRVIAREHPELRVALLDLDGAASLPALVAHCLHDDGEPEVAFHAGTRFVARLQRQPPAVQRATAISPDKSYLITGGLGALGHAVAQRLAERGARHLILVGRGEASAASLLALQTHGATVQYEQADLGRAQDVQRLMTTPRAVPLGGIVHCAGIVDDGLLMNQTPARFARVLAGKAYGAWLLHQYSQDMALDFFVLFSSQSAVIGRRGQGSYAAANAFLDSLAHLRRAQGLPAVSINWGGFAEMGMAARLGAADRERLHAEGLGLIPPSTGMDIFTSLLTPDAAQVGVFPVDWPRYLATYGSVVPPFFTRLLATLPRAAAPPVSPPASATLQALRATAASERPARLTRYVQECLAGIMGLDTPQAIHPDARLFDLGLDSIMALLLQESLELELGVSLSATLAFNHPTVNAIVGFLLAEVLSFADAAAPVDALAGEPPQATAAEETAGDEELRRQAQLLDEKLRQLAKWTD